jgi:electron transport complex protein RnfD
MMAEARTFQLSMSPHVVSKQNTRRVMFDVVIALLPALAGAVWFFGWVDALLPVVASVVTAVVVEYSCLRLMKRPVNAAFDGSAIVTGLLLAYNVPPGVPWWLPVLGSGFAIIVAKQAFGGLGHNLVNPALLGRAFLMASFPVLMTAGWSAPFDWSHSGDSGFETHAIMAADLSRVPGAEAITGATPLRVMKDSFAMDVHSGDTLRSVLSSGPTYINLLVGRRGGCIGETSVILLLAGAVYLVARKVLELRIPISYLGSVALFGWLFGGPGFFQGDALFSVLAGGVVLGGFFMATDMVTSPVTHSGRIIFGIGAGVITIVIRRWGGYPEGCSYSILIMNLATPLIDRFTRPRILGEVKGRA